jgi:glucosamine 6-phosphate synthetase-like amidotransferase/phosphosugar isomerase protein
LIIATDSGSKYAAEYGAYILKHLEIFDSVKVCKAESITKG